MVFTVTVISELGTALFRTGLLRGVWQRLWPFPVTANLGVGHISIMGDAKVTDDVSAPEIVYHYTSMEAMKKIVESATIWATSIRYLNDVSERDLFIGLIRERIPNPLLSTVGSGSVFERVQNPDNYYAEDFLQQPLCRFLFG